MVIFNLFCCAVVEREMFLREFPYLLLHMVQHLSTAQNLPILPVSNMVQHLSAAQNLLIPPVSNQASLLILKIVVLSAQLPQLQVPLMIARYEKFDVVVQLAHISSIITGCIGIPFFELKPEIGRLNCLFLDASILPPFHLFYSFTVYLVVYLEG